MVEPKNEVHNTTNDGITEKKRNIEGVEVMKHNNNEDYDWVNPEPALTSHKMCADADIVCSEPLVVQN